MKKFKWVDKEPFKKLIEWKTKRDAIKHYDRMITWAEKQDPDGII